VSPKKYADRFNHGGLPNMLHLFSKTQTKQGHKQGLRAVMKKR
jgi:hypothetical protein